MTASKRRTIQINNWHSPPRGDTSSRLTRTYRATTKAKKETGYAGGLELKIAQSLEAQGLTKGDGFEYETVRINFQKPSTTAFYRPDFILENGIIVEGKGRFSSADRQKHLLVKTQHPDLDVRFVFSNPNTRISKKSVTTYAMWCEQNGFKYAKGSVPEAWVKEAPDAVRLKALETFRGKNKD